jgi:hypothetical protein
MHAYVFISTGQPESGLGCYRGSTSSSPNATVIALLDDKASSQWQLHHQKIELQMLLM